METIIFIGVNKYGSSRDAIKAAEALGYFTVLITDRKILGEIEVHQIILSSLKKVEVINQQIQSLQKQGKVIKGIYSFIDPYVLLAAQLSEKYCSGISSAESIKQMEDKILTRELLKASPYSLSYSIYKPSEHSLKLFIQSQENNYPLIVKSALSAGSKDVILAENEKELKHSIQHLLEKNKGNWILVEEYLLGPQYLFEVLVVKGKIHIIAIIEQEITYFQRFIITGYHLLADVEQSFYEDAFQTVNSIIKLFNLDNGAAHLEMRLVEGKWKLIEVNPRISGGAMNRMIEVGTGINLVKETLRLYLGMKPNLDKKHNKYVFTQYLTIDETGTLIKVTGKKRCTSYHGVEEVYIMPRIGKVVNPPLSMGDRYGYVMAVSNSEGEAIQIAKEAAREIHFHLEPL